MRKIIGMLFIVLGCFVLITMVGNSGVSGWFFGNNPSTQSMTLDGVDTIEIDASSININIISETRENLKADLHGNGTNRADLTVERDGDEVRIDVDHGWFTLFSFGDTLKLDVYLPETYEQNMAVDLDSGNFAFHGPSKTHPVELNELELDMRSGLADLRNLSLHHFNHDASSGHMNAKWVTAQEASFEMSSGNIELEHYTGAFNAEFSSGRFVAQLDELAGPIDIEASSGTTSLDLPDDADFTIRGEMSSGSIHCDFPLENEQVKNGSVIAGTHGTGEYPVALEVSSGSVDIK